MKVKLSEDLAKLLAQENQRTMTVHDLPVWRVNKKKDPLDLFGLRTLLKKMDRVCLMKCYDRENPEKGSSYMLHGMVSLKNRYGVPNLYTSWISGWHLTSDIVKWEHAPDYVFVREYPPEHLRKEGEKVEISRFVSKVIRVYTLNSCYEVRY